MAEALERFQESVRELEAAFAEALRPATIRATAALAKFGQALEKAQRR